MAECCCEIKSKIGDFLFNRFEHEKKKSSESAPLFSSFPLAGSARAACRDEDTERGRTAGNFKLTSLSATLMTGGGAAEPEEAPQALPPPLSSLPPPPVLVRAAPDGAPPPLPHAGAPFPAITELGVFFTRERGAVKVEVFLSGGFFFSWASLAPMESEKKRQLFLSRAHAHASLHSCSFSRSRSSRVTRLQRDRHPGIRRYLGRGGQKKRKTGKREGR